MRLLLDTNIVIWFLAGSPRLAPETRTLIETGAERATVSAATVFEIATKAAIGKLPAPTDLVGTLVGAGFELLSITPQHAARVRDLPLHHRDPFDRLLIAQAQLEHHSLLTSDAELAAYELDLIVV